MSKNYLSDILFCSIPQISNGDLGYLIILESANAENKRYRSQIRIYDNRVLMCRQYYYNWQPSLELNVPLKQSGQHRDKSAELNYE